MTDILILTEDSRGRYLVTTQGSQHIWDLEVMTYQRLPGTASTDFVGDGLSLPITRIDRYPEVGKTSFVWFDDPEFPDAIEQWRQSSTIVSITQLFHDPS